MTDLLIQAIGWVLFALVVADLYVSVLYARSDLAVLSATLSHAVWRCFRFAAAQLGDSQKSRVLTFAGPTIVVCILLSWILLLLFGCAFIAWPALAEQVTKSEGKTPVDFATALYYSGYTLSTVGFGDIVPQSSFHRLLAVTQALLGFTVLTLGLTYVLSIYAALVRRNTFALMLHHRSGGTDDAAELLARIMAGGNLTTATIQLSEISRGLHDLYESHHSYPILHYFHFRDSFYATAQIIGITNELGALVATALDQKANEAFTASAAVAETRSGVSFISRLLAEVFLPQSYLDKEESEPSEEMRENWRGRFHRAVQRLADAGLAVTADREAAAERYVSLRREWNQEVAAFGRFMLAGSS